MNSEKNQKPVIIAVCGKGGVGKTSISAVITRVLAQSRGKKMLAIDADPAVGLAGALGVSVPRTVDDIRTELIDRVKRGEGGDHQEIIARLDYELFEAVTEHNHFAFLAIGRPELEGCYCQVNSFLKEIIANVTRGFDCVVIDGEAGIEQVNRRVMETVTHLILVSDASAKALRVAGTIRDVAEKAVAYEKSGLIVNRLQSEREKEKLAVPEGLTVLGWIPEDPVVREFDIAGKSLLEMPESAITRCVEECLHQMGIAV